MLIMEVQSFLIVDFRCRKSDFVFKIGDTFTIEPKFNPDRETYRCRVVEKIENQIFIDYPINENTGKTVYLMNESQLKVSFVSTDSSVYMFETQVLGRTIKGIPMIILSYPGKESLYRIQRRQFVRVETATDVAIHSTNQNFSPIVSITSDISAGGASVLLPPETKLTSGIIINTYFVLPMLSEEYHYVSLKSEVIRMIEGKNGDRDKVSLKFKEISEHVRLLFIKFCFERQLMVRKKA